MWRKKWNDLALIEDFIAHLEKFKLLKEAKWERIDEEVQKSIVPGTPSEDWIIPPDENETLAYLNQDPEYLSLKKKLLKAVPELKKIAQFLQFNTHHDFDWVCFKSNPLMGNDALEDALVISKRLAEACKKKNYLLRNLLIQLIQ